MLLLAETPHCLRHESVEREIGMVERRVGSISINRRTIRIGHQVYPLSHISRVQTVEVIPAGKRATFHPFGEMVGLTLFIFTAMAAIRRVLPELELASSGKDFVRRLVTIAVLIAVIRIVYLLCVVLYRLLIRRPRYVLMLETAGSQLAALSGPDPVEIERIEDEIVGAIEDPPINERIVNVRGDVVLGDKVGRDKYQQGAASSIHVNH
jgi:hypothetical protein